MTYKLTATITHKSFGDPVIKEIYFTGDTIADVLDRIKETGVPDSHMHNLAHYKKTAFKDDRGVKHKWTLEHMEHLN